MSERRLLPSLASDGGGPFLLGRPVCPERARRAHKRRDAENSVSKSSCGHHNQASWPVSGEEVNVGHRQLHRPFRARFRRQCFQEIERDQIQILYAHPGKELG